MRNLRQWVVWRSEERDGKETKVPYCPRTGRMASAANPETWASFSEATTASREGNYSGIGFVFAETDSYVGIDLDNCRDAETGNIQEWARQIISSLDSYTEVSPSRTGVHVICTGELPPGRNRKGNVEAYSRDRYFTVTGHHLEGTPRAVEERTKQLRDVARRVFGEPSVNGHGVAHRASGSVLEDDELIKAASEADDSGKFKELFAGGYCDLPSHSEAVAALLFKLAFWTGKNAEQMDRIFRRSGLMYEKFDSRRGESTWGSREIASAIEKTGETYEPPRGRLLAPRGGTDEEGPRPQPWPELDEAALHGVAGDVVRTTAPHTEADPVAVLANFLCAFGNAAGRGAFVRTEADKHHPNLFAALVGETAKARKGTSWGYVRNLMHGADVLWEEDRVESGLSSGEGLVYAVRDRVETESDGEMKVLDPGVSDKRLLVLEGEFGRVLKVMTREGNILSSVIRTAWDTGKLQTMTKNSPLKATDAHISIIGHITRSELLRLLSETDTSNGFANRFLWICVKRSKLLPEGGEWHTVDTTPLVRRISAALEFAKTPREVRFGPAARGMWREVYGPLSEGRPGLFGAAISRSETQTLRLAMLYATMDGCTTIEAEHLEAALALWSYAEASAAYIFGSATGDPVADQIVAALADAPEGTTRTELIHLFKRNRSAERIEQALSLLEALRRVRRERVETGGRPAERWFVQ